jgi:hypothetical protein
LAITTVVTTIAVSRLALLLRHLPVTERVPPLTFQFQTKWTFLRTAAFVFSFVFSFATAVSSMRAEERNICSHVDGKEPCSPEHVILELGFNAPYTLDKQEFENFVVADESIVGVFPRTANTFLFAPKLSGITNVLVYDKSNNLIKAFNVEVRGQVDVFNLPQSGSQRYRCWDTGCLYTGQTEYKKPAEVTKSENTITNITK